MSTVNAPKNGVATTQNAQEILAAHTTWRIDAAASRLEFTIRKRLMFVKQLTITGRFAGVKGTITLDEQEPSNSRADVTIEAASVDTGVARRDAHLRRTDFFDVEHHPRLTFVSHRIETLDRAAGRYRVTGDLTVRGVTREVSLMTHYTPAQQDAREPRVKLTLTGALNRRDFGIVWNKPYINVADDLTLALAVEAIRA